MPSLTHGRDHPKTAFSPPKTAPLVHTLETTLRNASQGTQRSVRAIHQAKIQASAIQLYKQLENDPASNLYSPAGDTRPKRSDELIKCRKTGVYARHVDTGIVKLFLSSYKIRWCPLCGSALNSWRAHTCSDWLVRCDRPKFTTLTTRHTDNPLDLQLKSLYQNLQALRCRPNFRKYVRGGIWFLHINWSAGDRPWHPHFHCLFDSAYYPQAELSADWQRASRGSTVVDIRKVRSHAKAVNDVVRYSASAADLSALSLDDGVTVYRACHGKRLCGTWGTAKGVQLKPPKMTDKIKWVRIGGKSIVNELRDSDPTAKAIYDAAVSGTFLAPGIEIQFTDDNIQTQDGIRRLTQGEWNDAPLENT